MNNLTSRQNLGPEIDEAFTESVGRLDFWSLFFAYLSDWQTTFYRYRCRRHGGVCRRSYCVGFYFRIIFAYPAFIFTSGDIIFFFALRRAALFSIVIRYYYRVFSEIYSRRRRFCPNESFFFFRSVRYIIFAGSWWMMV